MMNMMSVTYERNTYFYQNTNLITCRSDVGLIRYGPRNLVDCPLTVLKSFYVSITYEICNSKLLSCDISTSRF
jgi:hypothetical protein